jgi:hypothetical protein
MRGRRTLAEVVGQLGWSESKLSRIEGGKLNISPSDLERLITHYSATDRDRARLAALADQQRRPAWWEPYTDALTDEYAAYIAAESRATAIMNYEAQVVPGLLQTAEYAFAVIQADSTLHDPESINQRVQVRMARKAVLIREPQPRLRVVLDEAVLARPIGGVDVFKRQMLSLLEASERPNVDIQVLSFGIGAHHALAGSFSILEFSEGSHSITYSEGLTGGVVRDDPTDVEAYYESFSSISAAALNHEASRDVIKNIIGG